MLGLPGPQEQTTTNPGQNASGFGLRLAKALEYAGYDYRFEFATGGHTLRHGGALFANTLRWLWA